jgi:phosphoenolpyruvate-protein kinase (PTS system EI component)
MTNHKFVETEITMLGIGVSPGIVIARALLVEPGGTVKKRRISGDGSLALEQSRFRSAVARTEEKLRQVRAVCRRHGGLRLNHRYPYPHAEGQNDF